MGKPALSTAWPDDAPLSREQRIGAQRALTALGYDTQGVDGVIGANTRAALRRWQQASGRIADGYLTGDIAAELIRRGRLTRSQRRGAVPFDTLAPLQNMVQQSKGR